MDGVNLGVLTAGMVVFMAVLHQLSFEKPLYELEERL